MISERRNHARIDDAELAMITWSLGGDKLFQLGNVEDLSPTGVGVIVDTSLAAGTEVRLSYGEDDLRAIVRHCVPFEDRFLVGLQFLGDSVDSDLHFQPDMLTQPL